MNVRITPFTQGLLARWDVTTLEELIATKGVDLIKFFIGFSAFIAVAMLVVAGYMFITSAGDAEKVEKAQKAITAAIVGLIIVFLARAIVFFVVDLGDLEGGGSSSNPSGKSCNTINCIQSQEQWFECEGDSWKSIDVSNCPI